MALRRRARPLVPALLLALTLLVQPHAVSAQAFCAPGEAPAFKAGFGELARALGPTMGSPTECEHRDESSGDTHQRTTTGLAFYRPATNVAAFTDGYRKWALTPAGVVSWSGPENDPPATARTPVGIPADAVATPAASGWATVVEVLGPDRLTVRNARGERFTVVHAGLIGPHETQGDWRQRGLTEHARLLPARARVWLEAVDVSVGTSASPSSGQAETDAVRHVFTEADLTEPVAGSLLRRGLVWVYPHALHQYAELYADRQAEAVIARSGAWAETRSSEIFRARGTTHGGFPMDPRARPILDALDRIDLGNDVLQKVNRFPVEIGVSRLPERIIGYFAPRFYTVQLSQDAVDAPPEAVAAALIHELLHANQMIERGLTGEDAGCYGREIEAFEIAALYWQAIVGPQGKRPVGHWLEEELNQNLARYKDGSLPARVRASYVHQCGRAG